MADDRPSITCPLCGMRSYHPQDIAHRYCGRCHLFYDECEFRRRLDATKEDHDRPT